ncbi:MAG: MMPL family transporter [Pseudomonadota bacterium]
MIKTLIHRIAYASFTYPKTTLLTLLILLATSIVSLQNLRLDLSNEGTLRPDSPVRVNYNSFKETYGRDDFILVAVKRHESVSLDDSLAQFKDLKERIESSSDYIDTVDAFTNIRYTHSSNDVLYVNELSEAYKQGKWISPQAFLDFSINNPLYKNRFISDDQQYFALNILLKTVHGDNGDTDLLNLDTSSLLTDDITADATNDRSSTSTDDTLTKIGPNEISDVIESVLKITKDSDNEVYISGSSYVLDTLNKVTVKDSQKTGALALIFCISFLLLFFRRLSAILFPLTIINLSLIMTLGVMAFLDMPYTLYIGAMIPLMMAVGTADAVHIMARFFPAYEASGDKKESILEAIDFSAHAILLTSLTTAIGFVSFVIGDLESIANLGINMAFGVILAFLLTITVLPAGISLFKIKRQVGTRNLFAFIERYLTAISEFSIRNAKPIVAISVVLFVGLLFNTKHLIFSHDPAAILPAGEVAKRDYYHLNKVLKASNPIEVIIDTGKDDGIFDHNLLNAVDAVSKQFDETTFSGLHFNQPYSIINIVKEMHSALNNNQPNFYTLPNNSEVIRQEINLFESSAKDDLFKVVDENFQRLRITLMVEDADAVKYNEVLPKIEQTFKEALPQQTVIITGNTALVAETVPSALRTMYASYASAFIVITLLIMLMVKSIKLGLISIIPNILPILIALNLMIFMDWPLDLTSMMVGAIAIGIVVDDTLHYLHRYTEFVHHGMDSHQSIVSTAQTTGRAMLITSIIYAGTLMCDIFSSMTNIFIFGMSLSLITILALLSDLIITPALIMTFNKKAAK